MNICQVAWALFSILNALWLIEYSSLVIKDVNSWASAAMPIVAIILSMAILLWAGLYPAQLLFCTDWERMIVYYPPVIYNPYKLEDSNYFNNNTQCHLWQA